MKNFIFSCFCLLFFLYGYVRAMRCRNLLNSCFSINTIEYEDYPSPPDPIWPFNMYFSNELDSRLLDDTTPIEYWLNVTPNLVVGTFDGDVTIKILANKDTRTIMMHSDGLFIKEVVVTTCDINKSPKRIKSSVKPGSKEETNEDVLIINTDKLLSAKRHYKVKIVFSGYLYENNPFGFALYYDKYSSQEINYTAFMAETLFVPFFARRAFPCYDSIEYRTPFTLTIYHNRDETVISNIPQFSANEEGHKLSVTFKTTGFISTYMIYYAVLDKSYLKETSGKYSIRIFTTEEFLDQVTPAANDFETLTEKMKSYFYHSTEEKIKVTDLTLPVRNLENISCALSYTKKNFLINTNNCSQNYQMEITESIAYHVSNNWFDEYLHIGSWNDYWLKDGFGVYFSFELTSMVKSDWRLSDFHGSIIMQSVLYHDRRYFFYPLARSDSDMTRANLFRMMHSQTIFRFYNYKASLILRMLERIVGKFIFYEAIRTVIRDKKGTVFSPNDLWNAVEIEAFGNHSQSLSDVMNCYTTQVGYPLLTVILNEDGKIVVKQEPYVYSEEVNRGIWADYNWIVPITMTTQSDNTFENTSPIAWSVANTEITLQNQVQRDEWYILNLQNSAYVMVNYEKENWKLLIKQLLKNPKEIHHLNRVQLITDSHILAADGKLPVSIPIQLLTFIKNEYDPIVWIAALEQFKKFYSALGKDLRKLYQEYFTTCVKYEYRRIGFKINNEDDNVTKIWKSKMLNFLCRVGDEDCVKMANKEYNENRDDFTKINANLQSVILCTMLRGENSVSVSDALKEKIRKLGPAARTNVCLLNTIAETAGCEFIPYDSSSNSMIEDLIYDIIQNEDSNYISRLEGILFSWDTSSIILKAIENIILTWGEKNEKHENNVTDTEIKGMTNLLSYFEGNILGAVEADLLRNIRFIANITFVGNSSYDELLNTLTIVEQSIKPTRISNEILFEMSVKSYSCDPDKLQPFNIAIPRGDVVYDEMVDPRPGASDQDHDPLDEFWATFSSKNSVNV